MFSCIQILEAFLWFVLIALFFFSSRRRHTRCSRDWSSDVCSSDLFFPSLFPSSAGLPTSGWSLPQGSLAVRAVSRATRTLLLPVSASSPQKLFSADCWSRGSRSAAPSEIPERSLPRDTSLRRCRKRRHHSGYRLVPRPPHILHPESLVHRPLRKMLFQPPAANTLSASQSRLSSLAPPARLPRVLVPLYASFVRDLSGDRPRKELANTLDASLSPYRLICQGTCALIEGANGERPFQRGLPIAIRPRAFVTLVNSILLPLSRSLSVPRARPGSAIRQVFVFCGVVLNVCIRTDNMQHKKESLCLTMSQHWGPKDPSSWRSFSAGVIFDLAPLPQ